MEYFKDQHAHFVVIDFLRKILKNASLKELKILKKLLDFEFLTHKEYKIQKEPLRSILQK